VGALIESIERDRMRPIARSLCFRLLRLYESTCDFQQAVRKMGMNVDPLTTSAPPFTAEQANFLIKTYNDIIEDLRSHFAKKDSYVAKFSPIKELDKPTVNDVSKNLFMLGGEHPTNHEPSH